MTTATEARNTMITDAEQKLLNVGSEIPTVTVTPSSGWPETDLIYQGNTYRYQGNLTWKKEPRDAVEAARQRAMDEWTWPTKEETK